MDKRGYEKIFFNLDSSDWHGHASESLWGEKISAGTFKLMNSPFFFRGVSHQDIVRVANNSGINEFLDTIERGGHSTFMILIDPSSANWAKTWELLEIEGCSYESGLINISLGERILYSVDCPRQVNLDRIIRYLKDGEREGNWVYQEGCIEL